MRSTSRNGRLRAAYTLPLNGYYLRPFLDVDLIYTDAGAYAETGAGLLDRDVAASSNWVRNTRACRSLIWESAS